MARKKQPVFVPYKEILCLAIKELDREILDYEAGSHGGSAEAHELTSMLTEPLYAKSEILKELYFIETGVDY